VSPDAANRPRLTALHAKWYQTYYMAPEQRNEAVSLRLSREERLMLKGLTGAIGVSQSDILRMALREMWQRRFEGKTPKKK